MHIPTAAEIAAQFLAALEARLNQSTPPVARAFNRVLSVAFGMFGAGLYKYASDRLRQVLALTATGKWLDMIGSEHGVSRLPAVAAVLEVEATATAPLTVWAGTQWTAGANGETYTSLADVVVAAPGAVLIEVEASTPGEVGNLADGAELDIVSILAGLSTTADVDSTTTTGTERETDSAYRRRVLTRIRAAGGGGNAADYRQWALAVPGVRQAFPYAGKPRAHTVVPAGDLAIAVGPPGVLSLIGSATWENYFLLPGDRVTISDSGMGVNDGTYTVNHIVGTDVFIDGAFPGAEPAPNDLVATIESTPGDRTVYIEATTPAPDDVVVPPSYWGEPTAGLLNAVRAALLVDPETGLSRMPLGLVEERLYVEPITEGTPDADPGRVDVRVLIRGVYLDAALRSTFEDQVVVALTSYFWTRAKCFVEGLDYPGDRQDSITEVTLSTIVHGLLRALGGYAEAIELSIGRDPVPATAYQLNRGELAAIEDTVQVDAVAGGDGTTIWYEDFTSP